MPAPIFTRRHYRAIADLIRDADYLDPKTRAGLVSHFGAMFKADNSRFDPERFVAATKIDEPDIEARIRELQERNAVASVTGRITEPMRAELRAAYAQGEDAR